MNAKKFIAERMRAEGITQRELGKRLGINDRAVRYLLADPGRIRVEDMAVIADKLHITDREFLKLTRWAKGGRAC